MYPIQSQTPIASNVLAYQKELQRRTKRNSLGELSPVSSRKPSLLKKVLSLVNSMTNENQQLRERYQVA